MYKKYIFIAALLVISGCQQTSIDLGQYTLDTPSFSSYSTCDTQTLKNKEFNNLWHRMRSGFCFNSINSSRISQELKWMKKNKEFVYRSIERSKPYQRFSREWDFNHYLSGLSTEIFSEITLENT